MVAGCASKNAPDLRSQMTTKSQGAKIQTALRSQDLARCTPRSSQRSPHLDDVCELVPRFVRADLDSGRLRRLESGGEHDGSAAAAAEGGRAQAHVLLRGGVWWWSFLFAVVRLGGEVAICIQRLLPSYQNHHSKHAQPPALTKHQQPFHHPTPTPTPTQPSRSSSACAAAQTAAPLSATARRAPYP